MGQVGFLLNMLQCSGCRCCQIACKDKNDLPVGVLFREVHDFEGGQFPDVWAASLSLACNHCADPQCAANCPMGAYYRDAETGLMLRDDDLCISCKKCTLACPYGAPQYNPETDGVSKCNGCIDWLQNGLVPACVGACSTRALQFGEMEDLRQRFGNYDLVADVKDLPDSEISHPHLFIIPKEEMRR